MKLDILNYRTIPHLDRAKPPNRGYADVPVVFGPEAPQSESYEDICGPPTTCPDCQDVKDAKCRDSLPLYDLVGHLEIKPTDPFFQYPGLPNRTFGTVDAEDYYCICDCVK